MTRSKAAFALIVAGALMGCGSEGTSTNASAEPGKSGAAKTTSSQTPSASTAGTAGATKGTAAPEKANAPAAAGSVLKYMPKDCEETRAYANIAKIFPESTHAALDTLIAKGVAEGGADAKKGEEVIKVLKDGGIEPSKALKEFALCANKDDNKTVAAIGVDFSNADKPADVIAKAMETGTGVAPKREEIDGVTFLQTKDGKAWLAVIGKDTIVTSKGKDTLQAAIKGAGGEAEFAESAGHVVWVKAPSDEVDVKVKESGDNFDVVAKIKAGAQAAKVEADWTKMQPEIDKMADKMAFLKPLLPAAKNAKLTVDGEILNVTTNFPKNAIGDTLNAIKDMDFKELQKQMGGAF